MATDRSSMYAKMASLSSRPIASLWYLDREMLEECGIQQFTAPEGDSVLAFIGALEDDDTNKLPCKIIHTHYQLGVDGSAALCPAAMYVENCPVCEERKRLSDEGYEANRDAIKKLYPKFRSLWWIIDMKDEESIAKGIQIYDAPRTVLDHIIQVGRVGKSGDKFVDVSFVGFKQNVVLTRTGTTATNTKYIGARRYDRSDEEQEIVEALESEMNDLVDGESLLFSKFLVHPSYSQIAEIFHGYKTEEPDFDLDENEPDESDNKQEEKTKTDLKARLAELKRKKAVLKREE